MGKGVFAGAPKLKSNTDRGVGRIMRIAAGKCLGIANFGAMAQRIAAGAYAHYNDKDPGGDCNGAQRAPVAEMERNEIGRSSCRVRVCQFVSILVVSVS